MTTHEDLIALLSRNLTFSNPNNIDSHGLSDIPSPSNPPPITYSITQHYHHSAHQVTAAPAETQESTFGQQDREAAEDILRSHGVEPSNLFPSQVTLFMHAGPEEQFRLLELWRSSPPSYGGHELARDLNNWPATSLEQEEVMARLRQERQASEEERRLLLLSPPSISSQEEEMGDAEPDVPLALTPIEAGDGRSLAEPYILNGYDVDGYSDMIEPLTKPTTYVQAIDPVFKGSEYLGNFVGNQALGDQYGPFEHMRQYAQMSGGFAGVHELHDEEML
ncbi:hypothetical protein L228DRAFT_101795 [Xylona heveae TC161]|uniref:Uncharacterized protein n=1 Tax=Xylona heveae (strain CBS 132557 / TC161) TaxID=1328760 RepID=A0A165IBB5_XYLHT|nr:hypothetical protein L228DRAFT_101795 [Xylona heveae TC161]KZF24659.1 hypothetical protein L228DRAFT_101795 [Xylona heveae TC161]